MRVEADHPVLHPGVLAAQDLLGHAVPLHVVVPSRLGEPPAHPAAPVAAEEVGHHCSLTVPAAQRARLEPGDLRR
jgi:hypothetical protein